MINKLSPREKKLLILLLIVVFGVLSYKFVFQTELTKQAEFKEAYAAQKQKIKETKKITESYDGLVAESKKLEAQLAHLKLRFNKDSADGSREVRLGQDAEKDKVKVVLFQPLEVKTTEDFIQLPIKMVIEGRYFEISDFLTSVLGFYNVTDITDLSIKNEKPEVLRPDPILKASFTFSIYSTNPPEEASLQADLTQWTVGKLNSFSAGIRAIANFNATKEDLNVNTGDTDTGGIEADSGTGLKGEEVFPILK